MLSQRHDANPTFPGLARIKLLEHSRRLICHSDDDDLTQTHDTG
jgi:hypothetical protein